MQGTIARNRHNAMSHFTQLCSRISAGPGATAIELLLSQHGAVKTLDIHAEDNEFVAHKVS